MYGKIVYQSADRDFFFIRRVGQTKDLFCHITECLDTPEVGSWVSFELGERRGKPVAQDVRPLSEHDLIVALLGSPSSVGDRA